MLTDDGMWSDEEAEEEETESMEDNSEPDFEDEDIGFEDGAAVEDVDRGDDDDDLKCEVLTTEQVVEFLFKELKDVQSVVQGGVQQSPCLSSQFSVAIGRNCCTLRQMIHCLSIFNFELF